MYLQAQRATLGKMTGELLKTKGIQCLMMSQQNAAKTVATNEAAFKGNTKSSKMNVHNIKYTKVN